MSSRRWTRNLIGYFYRPDGTLFAATSLDISADDPPDAFPDIGRAMREPDGLLAAGGDLSSERLLSAYRLGIFPWFSVEAENFESIHNHNAYAYVERGSIDTEAV